MTQPALPTALDRLEKWSRKYYRFHILTGGYIQPGDGLVVRLQSPARTVEVAEDDFPGGTTPSHPLEACITEALRLWDADDRPKAYKAFWAHHTGGLPFTPPPGVTWKPWHTSSHFCLLRAELTARSDAEAVATVASGYPPDRPPHGVTVYETAVVPPARPDGPPAGNFPEK